MAKPGFDTAPASWGPPPLTARPEGFLSSLGIQSGGKYPQHLLPDLVPTYELGPWYREYNQTFRSITSGINLIGNAGDLIDTTLQVPDGKVWIVNRIGIRCRVNFTVTPGWGVFQLVRTNNADGTILTVSQPQRVDVASAAAPSSPGHTVLGLDYGPFLMRATVKLQIMICQLSGSISVGNQTSAHIGFLEANI